MNRIQEDVKEFMVAAGQFIATEPTIPSQEVRKLHAKLILEEVMETFYAMGFNLTWEIDPTNPEKAGQFVFVDREDMPEELDTLVDTIDGLADSSYVINGAANAWGLNLGDGHTAAHKSNMSKFIDGHRREDGKWIKGPSYKKANFEAVIIAGKLGLPLVQ